MNDPPARAVPAGNDTLLQYVCAKPQERGRLLRDDAALRVQVRDWVGPAAFAELEALPFADSPHLAGKPANLVFLPGIMGSLLVSQVGGMWWLDLLRARDKLDGLALSPDGIENADAQAGIRPVGIDSTYEPFARRMLQSDAFGLETFPFDWRRSPMSEAARLRDLVNRLHGEHGQRVHLVGHSMGGLVIRCALMAHGPDLWPKVGKIVFLATPHYGSPSIAGYLKNHLWGWEELAVIGTFLSRSTFRSLWGALSLLPAPIGVYPDARGAAKDHPCANFDLYRVDKWNLGLSASESAALQVGLDAAGELHRRLHRWHEKELLQEHKDSMLVVAGVGYETLFRLEFDERFWGIWKHTTRVTSRIDGDRHREGDGRVPLASAELEDVARRYVRAIDGREQEAVRTAEVSGEGRDREARRVLRGQKAVRLLRRWTDEVRDLRPEPRLDGSEETLFDDGKLAPPIIEAHQHRRKMRQIDDSANAEAVNELRRAKLAEPTSSVTTRLPLWALRQGPLHRGASTRSPRRHAGSQGK